MLNHIKNVGVIGAGTMGMGIAEVAASFGQCVFLFDVNHEFAHQAKQKMSKRLAYRVERQKISSQTKTSIENNIIIVDELEKLSDCQLVIEAIVEKLEIKQQLFSKLEDICQENTLLATNTSSISVTAIASILKKPENMIGLHFFNPAPVMKLVEVIAGLKSDPQHLQTGVALCEFWNKTPVMAASSPGFIVNRVARPFYGEALKMLQEGVANVECIDALMTAAGFRMGPFKLMDLIGIDVNFAVSQTVFAAMFYDPRYRPSLIQQEMVAANLLGKKTNQGFYHYDGRQESEQLPFEVEHHITEKITITHSNDHLNPLIKRIADLEQCDVDEHKQVAFLQVADCTVLLTNGMTCQQRIEHVSTDHVAQIDLALDYANSPIIHISFSENCPNQTRHSIIGVFQAIGHQVMIADDVPGLIVMRTVAMLINEAAGAVENGICSEKDVDLAMQKGVNYPIGLLDWAHQISIEHIVDTLDNLHKWFGDDRYRTSSWLRKKVL